MFPRYLFILWLSLAFLAADFQSSELRAENRSIDGTGNNLAHPLWGSIDQNFARLAPVAYADGVSVPALANRPNPRAVSNDLFRQSSSRPNARRLSGFVYTFGQLITHDVELTAPGSESIEFRIPPGDDIFTPGLRFPLTRSLFDPATGTGPDNPRQQINFATAFIDGSVIYGADDFTASVLRGGPAREGARLRTSDDINGDGLNLLPRDAFGPVANALFVAGDNRVNDNIVLTCIQAVFMREHNRLVDELAITNPTWSSNELYERARKIVGAELQAITFNEFLPALLGPYAPAAKGHYDPTIEPVVFNEFAAVFLRVGHSMLTNNFQRVLNDGQPSPAGPVDLVDAFENPALLTEAEDLDSFLKGLTREVQEETDLGLVFGMRVALLGAIDIQRARDHGLPDYNTLRESYGLPRVSSFAEITSNLDSQQALAGVYGNVDAIDPIVGALAEDLLPGASVGPLVAAGFQTQFARLRDGDRFWYENDPAFDEAELAILRQTRFSDILRRNTGVSNIPDNVFFAVPEPDALPLLLGMLLMQFGFFNRLPSAPFGSTRTRPAVSC
jgi:hypothetical protein